MRPRPPLAVIDRGAGFTTIELLIAMMILSLITIPLLSSFALGLGQTAANEQKTANSSDAQILSDYFVDDVASSDEVLAPANPVPTAAAAMQCGGSSVVLTLDWTDGTIHRYVDYGLVTNTLAGGDLHVPVYSLRRYYCEGSATGPVLSSQIMARTLGSATVTPMCDGSPCSVGPTRPLTVSFTLAELGRNTEPSYTFTVTATRRVST